jgi:50S ribosomal subunit-associated GTPase HflX
MPKPKSKILSGTPGLKDTDVQSQRKFFKDRIKKDTKSLKRLDKKSEKERARRHKDKVK